MIITRLFFKAQRSGLVLGYIPMPFQVLLFITAREFGLHARADGIICPALERHDTFCEIIESETDIEDDCYAMSASLEDGFDYWRGIKYGRLNENFLLGQFKCYLLECGGGEPGGIPCSQTAF